MIKKLAFTTKSPHSDIMDKPEHSAVHKPIHVSLACEHDNAKYLSRIC